MPNVGTNYRIPVVISRNGVVNILAENRGGSGSDEGNGACAATDLLRGGGSAVAARAQAQAAAEEGGALRCGGCRDEEEGRGNEAAATALAGESESEADAPDMVMVTDKADLF